MLGARTGFLESVPNKKMTLRSFAAGARYKYGVATPCNVLQDRAKAREASKTRRIQVIATPRLVGRVVWAQVLADTGQHAVGEMDE